MDGSSPILHVLDVGHGNAAILSYNGKAIVIDAGGGAIVIDALREMKIERIDYVLISHADADHIIGLQSMLEEHAIDIGVIRVNSDSAKDSKAWRSIVFETARRPGLVFEPALTTNQSGAFDVGDLALEIVAPSPQLAAIGHGGNDEKGRRLSANSMSVVARILWRGQPVILLPGDLDETGLRNAMERGANLSAEVLVFPHHGGLPSGDANRFVDELMSEVLPRVVIFSFGRTKFSNPHPNILERVRAHSGDSRICCTQLSKHCANTTTRKTTHPHLLPIAGRGHEQGQCCAGTISVVFGPPVDVLPDHAEHQAFIDANAPGALCRLKR